MIRILCVGKKHESWVVPGIKRYESRLQRPFNIKWELVAHSSLDSGMARINESQRILSKLTADECVILLDEVGSQLSSPALSELLHEQFVRAKRVTIVIGGAYGVTEEVQTRADIVLSLSSLVFPHQLVRLLLSEQLYRAQEIEKQSKYHHY